MEVGVDTELSGGRGKITSSVVGVVSLVVVGFNFLFHRLTINVLEAQKEIQ